MKTLLTVTQAFVWMAVSLVSAQSVCPHETDRNSLRYSKLGGTPHEKILYTDLDGDGDPDMIERWWNGKRVRWFDENDDATGSDVWGDMVSDSLQVDGNGDGFYDGPGDYCAKWADSDGDGVPDVQVYNKNPKASSKNVVNGGGVYFVAIDPDNTGRLMDIEWSDLSATFTRVENGPNDRGPNWRSGYHGNMTFLKEHAQVWSIVDSRYSWENPFHFFDPDGDGCSEVSVRVSDERIAAGNNRLRFDGIVEEAWVSYDLDNDTGRDNQTDYDLTLYVGGSPGVDYNDQVQEFPGLRAPEWVLPYYRYPEWRTQTRFVYLNRDGAVARLFGAQWARAYLTVDEDDDDHRWERVELYYPGDPYNLQRKGKKGESMLWHPQSDSLGDRGEWDEDFSGQARLYRAAWDGKIHLLGAERGAWTVDRNREFWGATCDNGVSSTVTATRVSEVIQYRDSDGNGYLDTIIYDYNGDQVPERTDSLLELGVDDTGILLNVGSSDWNALRCENVESANRSWKQAQRFYCAAFRHGFVDEEIYRLSRATSVQEKYENAFWMKESILRKLLAAAVSEEQRSGLLKSYYMNRAEDVERILRDMNETKTARQP
jgi:hypothetical protein